MRPSQQFALRLSGTVAACSALFVVAVLPADASPNFDELGYLDSTARCSAPATAVLFGATATARIAICTTSGGGYEYRGVRIRDGARLVLPASTATGGGYVADNDGISYTVTSKSVVVSAGSKVIRSESWLDFHGSATSSSPGPGPGPTSSSSTPTTPTTSMAPLPAEVGGSR